jgi:hypothetical protein
MAQFFSDDQNKLMTSVLNRIVPAEGKFPGAGDLGVAEFIDGVVSSSTTSRRSFDSGLKAIALVAETQHSALFESLDRNDQDDVLRDVETSHSQFFAELVRQTYNEYYINPQVIEALGLEVRPPQPKGYPLEIGNLHLIERVKARGTAYRAV